MHGEHSEGDIYAYTNTSKVTKTFFFFFDRDTTAGMKKRKGYERISPSSLPRRGSPLSPIIPSALNCNCIE